MTDYTKIDWNKAVQQTLADYENAKKGTSTERKEVDLTKYFTLALGQGEKSAERVFRILPLDATGKWYEVVRFHSLKVGNRWVKLYDPEQDGEESPLNETYRSLINGDKDDKAMANNYKSREFYIVRGIERGKEHEGVKFWRFPVVRDGSGIMDKIQPMMKRLNDKKAGSGAFFNPTDNGRDLIINVIVDPVKGYSKVSQIMFDEPSALSDDAAQSGAWLNDDTTWRDLYKKRPVEFLRIVAQGGEPVWDAEAKQFMTKVDDIGGGYVPQVTKAETPIPKPTDLTETISIDTDDLPF